MWYLEVLVIGDNMTNGIPEGEKYYFEYQGSLLISMRCFSREALGTCKVDLDIILEKCALGNNPALTGRLNG